MIYAIPSYKRADAQITLDYLRKIGVPSDRIYVFVQTEDDYKAYTERRGKECHVIYREGHSISQARNNVLNYFSGSDDVVMMDDDVSVISFGSKERPFKEIPDAAALDATFAEMFATTKRLRGYLFGLYPVYNEFFMGEDISTKVTVNTVIGFPKGFSLRFDERFTAKEDIELCGRILRAGGRVIRFNNAAYKAKHRTNKGGAYDTWATDANAAAAKELCLLYPKIFALQKNKPQEVRVVLKDEKVKGKMNYAR